jgi:hypothetical protein
VERPSFIASTKVFHGFLGLADKTWCDIAFLTTIAGSLGLGLVFGRRRWLGIAPFVMGTTGGYVLDLILPSASPCGCSSTVTFGAICYGLYRLGASIRHYFRFGFVQRFRASIVSFARPVVIFEYVSCVGLCAVLCHYGVGPRARDLDCGLSVDQWGVISLVAALVMSFGNGLAYGRRGTAGALGVLAGFVLGFSVASPPVMIVASIVTYACYRLGAGIRAATDPRLADLPPLPPQNSDSQRPGS